MVLKGFSESTIRSYQHELKAFFNYSEKYDCQSIGKEQIDRSLYKDSSYQQ